ALKEPGALAAVAVVLGHADHDDSLAYSRDFGPTPARRRVRLQPALCRAHGRAGRRVSGRWSDPADCGYIVARHSSRLAFRRESTRRAAALCACGEPAGGGPCILERLCAVELAPAGLYGRSLRISDRPILLHEVTFGS